MEEFIKENLYIFITILSYWIALQIDILKRDKDSRDSPIRFNLWFFLKDNALRLVFSFTLSLSLSVLYRIVFPAISGSADVSELNLWGLGIYVAIGAAPDLVIGYFKRHGSAILRPEEVKIKGETYERK